MDHPDVGVMGIVLTLERPPSSFQRKLESIIGGVELATNTKARTHAGRHLAITIAINPPNDHPIHTACGGNFLVTKLGLVMRASQARLGKPNPAYLEEHCRSRASEADTTKHSLVARKRPPSSFQRKLESIIGWILEGLWMPTYVGMTQIILRLA